MANSKDFAEVIRRKLAKDADLANAVENDRLGINVSQEIYHLRQECGLTQKQLADKINTQQSVIARLEDADYDGHSLKLLRRIAEAVGKRVEFRFVDVRPDVDAETIEIESGEIRWSSNAVSWSQIEISEPKADDVIESDEVCGVTQ